MCALREVMCRRREKTCFQMLVLSTDFPLCPKEVSMNNDLTVLVFGGDAGVAAAAGVTFPCMKTRTNGFPCQFSPPM